MDFDNDDFAPTREQVLGARERDIIGEIEETMEPDEEMPGDRPFGCICKWVGSGYIEDSPADRTRWTRWDDVPDCPLHGWGMEVAVN